MLLINIWYYDYFYVICKREYSFDVLIGDYVDLIIIWYSVIKCICFCNYLFLEIGVFMVLIVSICKEFM